MRHQRLSAIYALGISVVLVAGHQGAAAQDAGFQAKQVRVIIGFGAGGGYDPGRR